MTQDQLSTGTANNTSSVDNITEESEEGARLDSSGELFAVPSLPGFIQDFLKGGGNSWLTYLASTFGRPEMSRVPFEQVLDIFKQKNRRIEL